MQWSRRPLQPFPTPLYGNQGKRPPAPTSASRATATFDTHPRRINALAKPAPIATQLRESSNPTTPKPHHQSALCTINPSRSRANVMAKPREPRPATEQLIIRRATRHDGSSAVRDRDRATTSAPQRVTTERRRTPPRVLAPGRAGAGRHHPGSGSEAPGGGPVEPEGDVSEHRVGPRAAVLPKPTLAEPNPRCAGGAAVGWRRGWRGESPSPRLVSFGSLPASSSVRDTSSEQDRGYRCWSRTPASMWPWRCISHGVRGSLPTTTSFMATSLQGPFCLTKWGCWPMIPIRPWRCRSTPPLRLVP
jgi:hypothetical protein